MAAFLVALGLLAPLVLWVVAVYSALVGLRRRRDDAWGDVEFQLERRAELIPNLLAVAERCTALRTDPGFLALQEKLAEIEDAIQDARRSFDAAVHDLDARCEGFTAGVIALALGFQSGPRFENVSVAERAASRAPSESPLPREGCSSPSSRGSATASRTP